MPLYRLHLAGEIAGKSGAAGVMNAYILDESVDCDRRMERVISCTREQTMESQREMCLPHVQYVCHDKWFPF